MAAMEAAAPLLKAFEEGGDADVVAASVTTLRGALADAAAPAAGGAALSAGAASGAGGGMETMPAPPVQLENGSPPPQPVSTEQRGREGVVVRGPKREREHAGSRTPPRGDGGEACDVDQEGEEDSLGGDFEEAGDGANVLSDAAVQEALADAAAVLPC